MASHSEAHDHPAVSTYGKIALILTVITIAEVSAYYIKPWEESAIYVPSMLTMSAIKFFLVVAYYMHLKYEHKLFRALFSGPMMVATLTLIGLLFLFSKLVIRLGLLS
jgi:cytochrome c oxidase subunit IV